MQTVNFNCPFCGKLMAVGLNLLGRNVRCPHCKQVVQAPRTAGPPTEGPKTEPVPSFNLPSAPQESHESIFGEANDDDVFGARPPKVQMPNEPGAAPLPSPSAYGAEQLPATARIPSSQTATPYPDPEAPTVSVEAGTQPPLANPWATDATPARQPEPPRADDDEVSELPARTHSYTPRPAARESGSGGGILIWILLLYGAAATAGAAYLFFTRTSGEQSGGQQPARQHPFVDIPDFFGEYDRVQRKKLARIDGMPPANLDVPKELQVGLGDTLVVGDLHVKPVRVEYREVKRFRKEVGRDGFETKENERPLYLLHLRIKNNSDDLLIHPTDPAFNSRYFPQTKMTPYTGVVVGQQRYLGGPFLWPDPQYERQYVDGQENDDKPLGPKEERDYVIASVPNASDIRKALDAAKDSPAVWRVQLRRGLMTVKDDQGKDHDISVTSVIGVVFAAADVQ